MAILTFLSDLLTKAKTQIKPVVANVERILNPVTEFTRANPLTTGVALGTIAGAGVTLAGTKIATSISKKSTKKKKSKTSSSKKKKKTKKTTRRTTRRRKHKQRKPYTAGKRKDRSTKRIRFTKNNQPYIILKSGKARFIKKSSVRRMRKLKGGKY